MEKKTVFILQDNISSAQKLKDEFEETKDYEVIGFMADGISAIQTVVDKKPDFLITELVLLGYDGLCVISKIREAGIKTKIIVLSSLIREDIIHKSINAGADYFMAKPYRFSALCDVIKMVDKDMPKENYQNAYTENFHRISLEEKISKIFINVGIPPNIKGYSFLREGVCLAINEPEIINSVTKELYPRIGKKYNTTPSKVERAIRHAIEVAWSRGRIDGINNILGVRAYLNADKPTNSEFIALIADKMLLEKS